EAVLRAVASAGQHHLAHAIHPDQPRDADRPAAAEEDAALALRERKERRAIGETDVARCGQLEPTADDGALQDRDDRDRAELNRIEGTVPRARALECLHRRAP